MNRRGFFKALAASAVVAIGRNTFAQTALELIDDPVSIGRSYAEHLARSMSETKETLAANILNRAFT